MTHTASGRTPYYGEPRARTGSLEPHWGLWWAHNGAVMTHTASGRIPYYGEPRARIQLGATLGLRWSWLDTEPGRKTLYFGEPRARARIQLGATLGLRWSYTETAVGLHWGCCGATMEL